jgi:hypothetical protein
MACPTFSRAQRGASGSSTPAEVIVWYAESQAQGPRRPRKAPIGPRQPLRAARCRRSARPSTGHLRKEAALADKHELAAAAEAGLLVPIDEVEAIVVEEHMRVRTRILALPNELRPLLLTHLKNDRKAVEQCVREVEA